MPSRINTVPAAMLLAYGLSTDAEAQTVTAPMQPHMLIAAPDGTERADRPQRPRITSLEVGQMNRGQQRRVQQATAGAGRTPLPADQAAQRWASMDARAPGGAAGDAAGGPTATPAAAGLAGHAAVAIPPPQHEAARWSRGSSPAPDPSAPRSPPACRWRGRA